MADLVVAEVNSKKCAWRRNNGSTVSFTKLCAAEEKILSFIKTTYKSRYVDIGPVVGTADRIWTISLNTESQKTPILLLPGLGAGTALWVHNLDSFAENGPVYAIDCLGFGQSTRPVFSKDALLAEKQFVKSVEEWRREMNIDKMILLGHSLGGFLAASYAVSHPDRVKHLILADPWGFVDKPDDIAKEYNLSLLAKTLASVIQPLNPFWALRLAGPFGQWLVEKARPDLTRKFSSLVKDDTVIAQYIHQCNAQKPSGESAYHTMMSGFGWAKNPMIHRIVELRKDVPMTLVFGSKSWVKNFGETLKSSRAESFVNTEIIDGAGHHVYADIPEIFNKYVNEACNRADSSDDEPVAVISDKKDIVEVTQSDPEQENGNVRERAALPDSVALI